MCESKAVASDGVRDELSLSKKFAPNKFWHGSSTGSARQQFFLVTLHYNQHGVWSIACCTMREKFVFGALMEEWRGRNDTMDAGVSWRHVTIDKLHVSRVPSA